MTVLYRSNCPWRKRLVSMWYLYSGNFRHRPPYVPENTLIHKPYSGLAGMGGMFLKQSCIAALKTSRLEGWIFCSMSQSLFFYFYFYFSILHFTAAGEKNVFPWIDNSVCNTDIVSEEEMLYLVLNG